MNGRARANAAHAWRQRGGTQHPKKRVRILFEGIASKGLADIAGELHKRQK